MDADPSPLNLRKFVILEFQSVAHVVHHHTILVNEAFRLSYQLKLRMGQIWLVYARYAVGPLSKSVDLGRINAFGQSFGVGLLIRSV